MPKQITPASLAETLRRFPTDYGVPRFAKPGEDMAKAIARYKRQTRDRYKAKTTRFYPQFSPGQTTTAQYVAEWDRLNNLKPGGVNAPNTVPLTEEQAAAECAEANTTKAQLLPLLEQCITEDDAACLVHMKTRPEYVRRRLMEINASVRAAITILEGE